MSPLYSTSDDDDDLNCSSLDRQISCLSPPLDRLPSHSPTPLEAIPLDSTTASLNYLMMLFTAPDMPTFLQKNTFADGTFQLPMPLVTLLSEVNAETLTSLQHPGRPAQHSSLDQLKTMRNYLLVNANHDFSELGLILSSLLSNEDRLFSLIRSCKMKTT
ncbi:hypothetical protein DM01DRAFT_1374677 [Hesseltinella vesiculosa]|uniref:Uncharacterized protein n=1 Tax=Hesseltinella vesiculosa TaxID=101127 RepID=A0A1X2GGP1_9FUNG|nr:hypothetical protein DM01DRAFT_1374677 [Hesseltinella vesiculosa]